MTAREYGYQILPGTAAQTPKVLDKVRREARTSLYWGLPILAAQLGLTAWLIPQEGPAGALGVLTAVTTLVTLGVVAAWHRARRTELRILRSSPWEVWPCRVEKVRVVTASGERAGGRRWGSAGRLVLLTPDGQSRCSFPVPGPGVKDEVWFAGDVDTKGILAVPGGSSFRYVSRTRK